MTPQNQHKKTVIERLQAKLGQERVEASPNVLKERVASFRGLGCVSAPLCISYPGSTEDVQVIVALAQEQHINLVPCSSEGGPRTTGSSLPAIDGSVIVDLSRMKKILRIDAKNRVALIEPGVTFPELSAAVAPHGMRVSYPLQPRANKSVLGAYLDREPTLIPKNHWDASDPLLCIEFVFGTGEVFRTGSAAGPGTLEEQWASGVAQNNPMGPSHTDLGRAILGAQGTLGIVTWGSVRLDYKPQVQNVLYVQANDLKALEAFTYAGVRQRIGDEYLVLNNVALASILAVDADKATALSRDMPAWTLILTVAGYRYFPNEKLAYQITDLKALAEKCGVALKESLAGVDNEKVVSLLGSATQGVTWKYRFQNQSLNIAFLTTLNRTGVYQEIVAGLVRQSAFGLSQLGVYLQPVMQSRNCHIEFNLPYASAEKSKAEALHAALISALIDAGAFFSRPHGPVAAPVFDKLPMHAAMVAKMKTLLDPKGILNRGKLCCQ